MKIRRALRTIGPLAIIGLFSLAAARFLPGIQTPIPEVQRSKMFLSMEWLGSGGWKAIDAQSVFKAQDKIRFRFHTPMAGFLYILDQTSDGRVAWVYPAPHKLDANYLTANSDIIIPGTDGSLAVKGPAGLDTLFWVLRKSPFAIPQVAEEDLDPPSNQIAVCPNDKRSCVDRNAGAKPVADLAKLTYALRISGSMLARDLAFDSKPQGIEIGTGTFSGFDGVIFQTKIAHK